MTQSEKPQNMQQLMAYYDKTIDELQFEIEVLKEENQRLQGIIDERAAGQTYGTADGLISRGQEVDLYPNEIREIIVSILKDARGGIKDSTRRSDVVDDILKANPTEDSPAARAKTIQAIFKGYTNMDASIRKRLNDVGIGVPIKISAHYKANYYNDDRYKVTISASCSDRRGGDNTAAEIIRKFL